MANGSCGIILLVTERYQSSQKGSAMVDQKLVSSLCDAAARDMKVVGSNLYRTVRELTYIDRDIDRKYQVVKSVYVKIDDANYRIPILFDDGETNEFYDTAQSLLNFTVDCLYEYYCAVSETLGGDVKYDSSYDYFTNNVGVDIKTTPVTDRFLKHTASQMRLASKHMDKFKQEVTDNNRLTFIDNILLYVDQKIYRLPVFIDDGRDNQYDETPYGLIAAMFDSLDDYYRDAAYWYYRRNTD
jgi:hypothetical protein